MHCGNECPESRLQVDIYFKSKYLWLKRAIFALNLLNVKFLCAFLKFNAEVFLPEFLNRMCMYKEPQVCGRDSLRCGCYWKCSEFLTYKISSLGLPCIMGVTHVCNLPQDNNRVIAVNRKIRFQSFLQVFFFECWKIVLLWCWHEWYLQFRNW